MTVSSLHKTNFKWVKNYSQPCLGAFSWATVVLALKLYPEQAAGSDMPQVPVC